MSIIPIKPNNRAGKREPRPKDKNGLTPKQEAFAQAVASGKSYTQAFKDAYNTEGMKPESIRVNASMTADKPHINARIKQLQAERMDRSMLKDALAVRQFIFDNLMEIAGNQDSSNTEKMKAMELMGKINVVGAFTERSSVEHNNIGASEEIEKSLKEKLAELKDIIKANDGDR